MFSPQRAHETTSILSDTILHGGADNATNTLELLPRYDFAAEGIHVAEPMRNNRSILLLFPCPNQGN